MSTKCEHCGRDIPAPNNSPERIQARRAAIEAADPLYDATMAGVRRARRRGRISRTKARRLYSALNHERWHSIIEA